MISLIKIRHYHREHAGDSFLREKLESMSAESVLGDVEYRVKVAISEYGEKAKIVLRAAIESAEELRMKSAARLGDFDYKTLKKKLREQSINYNPSLLLRALERDYMIIETSYKSSNQHWWVFLDEDAVRRVVLEEELTEDPEVIVLKTQYKTLKPRELLETLARIESKKKLNEIDKKILRRIAFEELDLVVKILGRMRERRDLFENEIRVLEEILRRASRAASRI